MQIGLGISPTIPANVAIPFNPASISGLQLWLDASDASTLFTDSAGTTAATADGDPVGQWSDKSGNGNHTAQSDGTKKPLLKLSIQNGRNIARFDGTNDVLTTNLSPNSSNRTIIIVAKMASTTAAWRGAVTLNTTDINDTNGTTMYCIWQSGAYNNSLHGGRIAGTYEYAYTANGTYFFAVSQTNTLTGSTARFNGVSAGSNSHASQSIGNGTQARIGTGRLAGSEGWYGDIAEVLIYDSVLSLANIGLLESYLNAKWLPFIPASIPGLQLWLDASDASTLFQDSAGTTAATANGDPVGRWSDKSGNARHAIQTDGTKKPTRTNNAQNAKSGLTFDGVNDYLELSSGLTGQPFSYLFVGKFLSLTGDQRQIVGTNDTGNFDQVNGTLNLYSGATGMVGFKSTPTSAFIARIEFNGSSSKYQENNGTVYTGNAGSGWPSNLHLGSNAYNWQFGNVLQLEICVFNRLLTSSELSSITAYLNGKWSVY